MDTSRATEAAILPDIPQNNAIPATQPAATSHRDFFPKKIKTRTPAAAATDTSAARQVDNASAAIKYSIAMIFNDLCDTMRLNNPVTLYCICQKNNTMASTAAYKVWSGKNGMGDSNAWSARKPKRLWWAMVYSATPAMETTNQGSDCRQSAGQNAMPTAKSHH